ncbi:hypothetical protein Gotri_023638 [Gossypium trilobum]|uniref:Small EDRK-rich factor-like N-terminal domain-containing protein n=2 Tax=Gossypium TaxID=3633 RepID=A0A7J9DJM0_9ROSI|nr:hypothetical protein [Gossypium trilobum]
MGGGNAQKSKMAREKNLEKAKNAAKGSQLETNKKAMTIQVIFFLFLCFFFCLVLLLFDNFFVDLPLLCIQSSYGLCIEQRKGLIGKFLLLTFNSFKMQCKVCMQTFICTTSEVKCREHAEAKHPKSDVYACFPHLKK